MIRRNLLLLVASLSFLIATPLGATWSGSVAMAAPKRSMTVPTFKEAWYAQAPPCVSIDCSVVPPATPYPEDTLHVAVSLGEEAARTYVAFSFLLPLDARLTGGTLKLPLDTDPTHGNVSPESADMVACLATPKFKRVRGSFDKPPRTNCDVRRSAIYDEKRVAFTVDLDHFVEKWKKGRAALALMPSKSAQEGGETWHVVFPAAKKEDGADEKARAIIATLSYTVPAGAESGEPALGPVSNPLPTGSGPPSDFGSTAESSFSGATSFGRPAPPETAAPTEVTSPQQAVSAISLIEGFAGPGFAYPMVWALPLVLLVGLGSVGRALTKKLYRRDA